MHVCMHTQSCLTLSSVRGILQARILEWEPCPPPGDLPDPGIEPLSPVLAGGFFTTEPPGTSQNYNIPHQNL